MDRIDRVLNLDWSEAQCAGGGVYVLDSTHRTGIPSVAVRADRGGKQHVILLEKKVFESLARSGGAMLARQNNIRRAAIVTHAMHANPAFGCEMYGCPPACQYADRPGLEAPDRWLAGTKPGPAGTAAPNQPPAGRKQENEDEQRTKISEREGETD